MAHWRPTVTNDEKERYERALQKLYQSTDTNAFADSVQKQQKSILERLNSTAYKDRTARNQLQKDIYAYKTNLTRLKSFGYDVKDMTSQADSFQREKDRQTNVFSRFDNEDSYNDWNWRNKYNGKSVTDIDNILNKFGPFTDEDKKELDWLKTNRDTFMTTDELKDEIKRLEDKSETDRSNKSGALFERLGYAMGNANGTTTPYGATKKAAGDYTASGNELTETNARLQKLKTMLSERDDFDPEEAYKEADKHNIFSVLSPDYSYSDYANDKDSKRIYGNAATKRRDEKNLEIISSDRELSGDMIAFDNYSKQSDPTSNSPEAVTAAEKIRDITEKWKSRGLDFYELHKSYERNVNKENSERLKSDVQAIADKHPVISSAVSIGTNLAGGIQPAAQSLAAGIIDLVSDDIVTLDTNSPEWALKNATDTIRETVSEKIENEGIGKSGKFGKLGSFLYQTGMSMADFITTTTATGFQEPLTLAVMGTNAAVDSMKEVTERGGTVSEAVLTGFLSGVFEALFEKVSVENLFRAVQTNTGRKYLYNVFKGFVSEGSEEVATDLANTVADALININNSEFNNNVISYMNSGCDVTEAKALAAKDSVVNLAASFAGGALSGGIIATVGGGISLRQANKQYASIGNDIQANGNEDLLMQAGREVAAQNPDIQYDLGVIDKRNQKAYNKEYSLQEKAVIPEAVGNRLTELGMNEADSGTNAKAITDKYLKGKPFKSDNNIANRVYTELLSSENETGRENYTNQWAADARNQIESKAKENAKGKVKYKASEIGRLYSDVQNTLNEKAGNAAENTFKDGIKSRLSELGMDKSTLNKGADIIYKAVKDGKLTGREYNLIETVPAIKRTYTELSGTDTPQEKYNNMTSAQRRLNSAVITSTGANTTVIDAAEKTDNGITLNLSDGQTAFIPSKSESSSALPENTVSVTISDPAVRSVIDFAAKSDNWSIETINDFISGYKPGQNVLAYMNGFISMYNKGLKGEKFNTAHIKISDVQSRTAFAAGRADIAGNGWTVELSANAADTYNEIAKKSQNLGSLKNNRSKNTEADEAATENISKTGQTENARELITGSNYKLIKEIRDTDYKSGVTRLDSGKKLDAGKSYQLAVLNEYGKKHNISFISVDTLSSEAGNANGLTIGGTNKIIIALDAEAGAILSVAGHEVFHYIKNQNAADAQILEDFVINHLKQSDKFDYDKRFNELAKRYGTYDETEINEEIAANSMFDVIANENTVNELINENPPLIKKIGNAIKKFIDYIKEAINALAQAGWDEAGALKDDLEMLETIRAMYDAALWKTEQNNKNTASDNENGEKVKYALKPYDEHQRENWKDSKRIVLYDNDNQFRDFIDNSSSNNDFTKKIYFGAVSHELAVAIKSATGINVEGYNCSLSANEIRKMFKSHGNENTENSRGQRAITIDDIIKIPDVIQSPDTIRLSDSSYNGKPVILFTKLVGGQMTVVSIVSDKHLDLFVQTTYINRKKESLATPIDAKTPILTSETSSGTAFNTRISQTNSDVNTQYTQNDEKNSLKASGIEEKKDGANNENGDISTGIKFSRKMSDYPYNMQTVIHEYLESVDNTILEYAEQCKANKDTQNKRIRINEVSDKQANDIMSLIGLDFHGYQNTLDKSGLNHIERRHGEKGKADYTMKNLNDVARVGYILHNYDSIELTDDADGNERFSRQFRDKNNNPAPLIKFTKKINGTYYAVIACPEARYKKLWLVTAYIGQKNSSSVTQESDDNISPDRTSKTGLASPKATDNSITDSDENVNNNFSKFSLKETAQAAMTREELIKSNSELKEANRILRNEFKLTGGGTLSMENAKMLAKQTVKGYSSNYDADKLANRFYELFRWYDSGDIPVDAGEAFSRYDYLMDALTKIGGDVIEESAALDTSLYDEYNEARNWIKNMRFTLPDEVLSQLNENHDGKFVQHAFGKTRYVSKIKNPDAPYLSSIYSELASAYPNFFSENDNEYEQPQKLLDFWDAIKPIYRGGPETIGFGSKEEASAAIAYGIMESYMELPKHRTFADKSQARTNKAVNEYKEKMRLAIKKISENNEKKLKEQRQYYRNIISNAHEEGRRSYEKSMERVRLRASVIREFNNLSRRFNSPTDKSHIPEKLSGLIGDFLHLFDDGVFILDAKSITAFKDTYEKALNTEKNSDAEDSLAVYFDPDIAVQLENLSDSIKQRQAKMKNNTQIKVMTLEEETILENVAKHLHHLVVMSDTLLIDGKRKSRTETAERAIKELNEIHDVNFSKFTAYNMKPYMFFKKLGSTFLEAFNDILDAEHKGGLLIAKSKEDILKILEANGFNSWGDDIDSKNKAISITTEDGENISLTINQALGIYAIAKREATNGQEAKHLSAGGIVFRDKVNNKLGKGTKRDVTPVRLTINDVQKITRQLTKQQLSFADAMIDYLSKDIAELGNEVSMKLFGYKKFNEKFYYPFHTDKNYVSGSVIEGKQKNSNTKAHQKNKSYTKSTVIGAATPVVAENFTEVVSEHIADMINYNTLSIPQENLNSLLNYKQKNILSESFSKQVDAVLDNTFPKETTHANLGNTPKALTDLGLKDRPMLMTANHIYSISVSEEQAKKENRYWKNMHYHNLGAELVKQLPDALKNPVAILKSNNDDSNTDIVIVTSLADKNNSPVIAAIKVDGDGYVNNIEIKTNLIKSAYGKDNFNGYFKRAVDDNRLLIFNNKKSQELTKIPGVQFPDNLLSLDLNDNVAHYREIVNTYYAKNNGKNTENKGNSKNKPLITMKNALENSLGKYGSIYVSNYIDALSGGLRSDPAEGFFNKMLGKFKKVKVAANLSVIIQQSSAVGRALIMIDPKYFLTTAKWKGYEELKKYSGIAVIKEMGRYDIDTGRGTAEWLMQPDFSGKDLETVKKKAKAFFKLGDSSYRDDVMGWAAGKADEVTWNLIWQAVKAEIADTKHLSGEELLRTAGKRFNEVIEATQVYDSVISRSPYMQSNAGLVRMATAFMAEPVTTINLLHDALFQFRQNKTPQNAKYLSRAIGGYLAASLLNAFLKSFITAARDDDENLSYAEKYVEALINNSLSEISLLQKLPIIKDLISLFQGYDISRTDMDIISDFMDNVEKLFALGKDSYKEKTEKEQQEQLKATIINIFGSLGAFAGLPITNIIRDSNAIIRFGNALKDDKKPSLQGIKYSSIEGIISAFDNRWVNPAESLRDDENDVYKAMLSGDESKLAEAWDKYESYLIYMGKTEDDAYKKVRSDVKKKLKVGVLNGKIEDGDAEKYLIDYLDDENGYWTVKEWHFASKEENDGLSFSKYDRLKSEVLKGGDISDAVKELTDHNTKEKSVQTHVSDIIHEAFDNDEITEEKMRKLLDTYKGFAVTQSIITNPVEDEKDIVRLADKWEGNKGLPEGEYYTSFDALDEAVLENLNAESAIEKLKNELMYSDSDIRSHIKESLRDAYNDKTLTKREVISRLTKYADCTQEQAANKIKVWDFKMKNPDAEITDDGVILNYLEVSESGISLNVFEDYYERQGKCKGRTDANGKTISGSKKAEIMKVIDSLPLTSRQKDELYYLNNWSESTIHEAPWR